MTNLSQIVSKTAPILGLALNSIFPGSGLLVSGIASLFGANSQNEADIIANINANPEAALKLKQFEMDHIVELNKMVMADRDSARNREAIIVTQTHKRDWLMDFIAIFILVSFYALCLIVAFTKADGSDRDLFYMLLGTFSSAFGFVMSYYFGGTFPRPQIQPSQGSSRDIVLPEPRNTMK